MTSVSGLGNLKYVYENVVIEFNDGIKYLRSLHNLRFIGNVLSIEFNEVLPTCEAEAVKDILESRGWNGNVNINFNDDNGECSFVEQAWSKSTSDNSIFVGAVSMPEGGLLVYTSFGDVYRLSESGDMSLIYAGVGDIPQYRILLNPGGNTFLIKKKDGSLLLYKNDGTNIGAFSIAGSYMARPVTGTDLILIPQRYYDGGDGESTSPVTGGNIVDASGVIQTQFSTDGLSGLKITSSRMVYFNHNEIIALNHQGEELWRTTQKVESYAVSSQATKLIVEDGENTNRVLHLDGQTQTHTIDFDNVVWNVAMSQNGEYSAATTKQSVHIFNNGELQKSVVRPVAFTASLDVSDNGEIVVGGKDSNGIPLLFVFNDSGILLWEEKGTNVDNYGWRPEVTFQSAGEAFTSRTKHGLDFFQIIRK